MLFYFISRFFIIFSRHDISLTNVTFLLFNFFSILFFHTFCGISCLAEVITELFTHESSEILIGRLVANADDFDDIEGQHDHNDECTEAACDDEY